MLFRSIGKEGQNARLAAKLTGFKIDIKSETQAKEIEGWLDVDEEYEEYEDFEVYQEEQAALAAYQEEYPDGEEYPEDGAYLDAYEEAYEGEPEDSDYDSQEPFED